MGPSQGAWSEDPGGGGLSSALGDTGATGSLQRSDTISHALGSWMRTVGNWAGDSTGTRLEPGSKYEGRGDRFTGGLDVGVTERSQEDPHFCPRGQKGGADTVTWGRLARTVRVWALCHLWTWTQVTGGIYLQAHLCPCPADLGDSSLGFPLAVLQAWFCRAARLCPLPYCGGIRVSRCSSPTPSCLH